MNPQSLEELKQILEKAKTVEVFTHAQHMTKQEICERLTVLIQQHEGGG
jgi:hypothetical protein